MNELQLANFKQSQRLQKAGFNWETTSGYIDNSETFKEPFLFKGGEAADYNNNSVFGDDVVSAPTVALALKWFRDVKGVLAMINIEHRETDDYYETGDRSNDGYYEFECFIQTNKRYDLECIAKSNTYETAESALLDALLDLIEKQKGENDGTK